MNIGRYQVDGELGRGGFGVVYSAVDSGLGRAVAIKGLLDPGADPAELIVPLWDGSNPRLQATASARSAAE